jgi:hypothetical protein
MQEAILQKKKGLYIGGRCLFRPIFGQPGEACYSLLDRGRQDYKWLTDMPWELLSAGKSGWAASSCLPGTVALPALVHKYIAA